MDESPKRQSPSRLDLRQLRYFLTVAQTLHFGRAATQLHMAQPPLSRHIALLEKELGAKLFERTSRKVTLTAAGTQLQRDAHQILELLEAVPARVQAASRGTIGEVRLGFTMYAANSVLPALVRQFKTQYPNVEIILQEKLPREIVAELLANKLDVAITIQGETDSRLQAQTIWQESLCVALPSAHRCAQSSTINLKDLSEDNFILVSRNTTRVLHDAVLNSCRTAGFEPQILLETHLQQTIVSLVAEGLAVALVPNSMQKVQLEGLTYRPLQNAPLIDQVVLLKPNTPNPAAKAITQFALSITA